MADNPARNLNDQLISCAAAGNLAGIVKRLAQGADPTTKNPWLYPWPLPTVTPDAWRF